MKIVNQNEISRYLNLDLAEKNNNLMNDYSTTSLSEKNKLNIDIVSDLICPWCFIGKRRLDKAIKMLNDDNEDQNKYNISIAWHPFQLNPNMPKEGMNRKIYRTVKFGSWDASLSLDRHVVEIGLMEDINFAFDRIERTPNTLDAHRLIWLAQKLRKQDKIVDALYKAYFVEGLDIGNLNVLVDIASTNGVDAQSTESFLKSKDGIREVQLEQSKAQQTGINAVPYFLINGKFSISGAQDAKTLLAALKDAIDATSNRESP